MARPPIAQLIYEQRVRLELSKREAAARAGISEGSWRRTESDRALKRTDETIARMAGAVGITPEQLTGMGWSGAAEYLRMLRQPPPSTEPIPDNVQAWLLHFDRKLDRLFSEREPRDKEDPDEDNGSRHAI